MSQTTSSFTIDIPITSAILPDVTQCACMFAQKDTLWMYNSFQNCVLVAQFHVPTKSCQILKHLELPIYLNANVTVNNFVYLFGGRTLNYKLMDTKMRKYHSFSDTLQLKASNNALLVPRCSHSMVYCCKRHVLYMFGGIGENQKMCDYLWCYDLALEQWTAVKQVNEIAPRYSHAMVYYKALDCLLVFGGTSRPKEQQSQVQLFDLQSYTWSQYDTLPSGIVLELGQLLSAHWLNDDTLVLLGNQSMSSVAQRFNNVPDTSNCAHHLYHVPSKTWSELCNLPHLQYNFASCAFGEQGYAVAVDNKIHIVQVHGIASRASNLEYHMGCKMCKSTVFCDVSILLQK